MSEVIRYLFAFVAGAVCVAFGSQQWNRRRSVRRWMPHVLRQHFRTRDLEMLLVAERRFPLHMRGEIDRALRQTFENEATLLQCLGIKKEYSFAEVSFTEMVDETSRHFASAPQFEEINIGEDRPLSVIRNGLWLGDRRGTRFAVVSTQDTNPCGGGSVRLQVITPNDSPGADWSRQLFQQCEQAVADSRSYRGKILSFEAQDSYTGETTGITIHNLRTVRREDVILPQSTLELLERNVIEFSRHRDSLARFGQSTKKGLLFYGPPGTGKTHTIHYLSRAVPDQTVFIIAAEQVKHLADYMTLARFLQPSMVVVEDVDLIARERSMHEDPASEVLLNKLLNEMDGLRDDASVLFIPTTNRPEALEAALTARPGRIDQAIEFPLPDAAGRERLVRLYGKGITFEDDAVVSRLVNQTEGVSAAFIKEAVRRAMQCSLQRDSNAALSQLDVDQALEEMLTSGGALNRFLLGAGRADHDDRNGPKDAACRL
ncbi:MAG: ATP-binding protein [Pirellulales bacterium]